jgi:hypothetical protein
VVGVLGGVVLGLATKASCMKERSPLRLGLGPAAIIGIVSVASLLLLTLVPSSDVADALALVVVVGFLATLRWAAIRGGRRKPL